MPNDTFQNTADSLVAPAERCFAIVPSDENELPMITKAIYVGEAGDVTLRAKEATVDVVFRNVPAGMIIDVRTAFAASG